MVGYPAELHASILVVEDTPVLLRQTVSALERAGYHCLAATNGQEAVDLFQTEHLDLIVLDWQMPVMDGITAANRIRDLERGSHNQPIPMILYSSIARDAAQQCAAVGITDTVSKGDLRTLLAKIKVAL